MVKYVFTSAALMGLAACGAGGGGDKTAIVDACVSEGTMGQESCECFAGSLEDSLDSALFAKFADAAKNGTEMSAEDLDAYTAAEKQQMGSAVLKAAMTCATS